MISSVGFSHVNTQAFKGTEAVSGFQEKIAQPQKYAVTEKPQAASGLINDNKNSSTTKKVAIAGLIVAAGAAILAIAANKGFFSSENANKGVEALNNIGNSIYDAGTNLVDKAKTALTNLRDNFSKKEPVVPEETIDAAVDLGHNAVEEMSDIAEKGRQIKGKTIETAQTLADAVKKSDSNL